jgi:hypothetical protein
VAIPLGINFVESSNTVSPVFFKVYCIIVLIIQHYSPVASNPDMVALDEGQVEITQNGSNARTLLEKSGFFPVPRESEEEESSS